MTRDEMFAGYLDLALTNLRTTHSSRPFGVADVRQAVIADVGEFPNDFTDEEIGEALYERWGDGIEPAGMGKTLFRFGYGQPPVSREINGPH